MFKRVHAPFVTCLLVSLGLAYGGLSTTKTPEADDALHIDIPVKLAKANVVLNMISSRLRAICPSPSGTWAYS